MPIYTYKCPECDEQFERVLKLAQFDEPQACPQCGHEPTKRIIASPVGFILRGDGWPGKNNRVRSQMNSRRKTAGVRQDQMRHDGPKMELAPNVQGERTGSWTDAQKLAKSKGKDTSSYDPMIRKERSKK